MHVYEDPSSTNSYHDAARTGCEEFLVFRILRDCVLWIGVIITGFAINVFTLVKHGLVFIICLQMNDIAQTWSHHQPVTSKQVFLILFEIALYMLVNSTREFSNRVYKENVGPQLHHLTNMSDELK